MVVSLKRVKDPMIFPTILLSRELINVALHFSIKTSRTLYHWEMNESEPIDFLHQISTTSLEDFLFQTFHEMQPELGRIY